MKSLSLLLLGILLGASLNGCSSARMDDHESDSLFQRRDYDGAVAHLQKGLDAQGENGRDSLLYILDLGLALHTAGRYEESNKVFHQAEKIAEIKDYTSIATEGATLLASENITGYKGEDFEKVLINVYLSMNYALMGNVEDALVEARVVNRKLGMMVSEGKRKYKQNAFARYISAIMYESQDAVNDSYIDYKNAQRLVPQIHELGRDLFRSGVLNEDDEGAEQWAQQYGLTPQEKKQAMRAAPHSPYGEIIVLYENGISPVKRPNPSFQSVPRFYPRYNPVAHALATVTQQGVPQTAETDTRQTDTFENIEATAIENLDEKWSGIVAKKIGATVAKGVVAAAIAQETRSPMLGYLAGVLLMKADKADLRSWNLLPRDLQVARFPVTPGTYEVKCAPEGVLPLPTKTIQVGAGKKVFVDFRYMP